MRNVAFAGERVALPTGIAPATVHVHDGKVVAVEPLGSHVRSGATVVELGAAVLLPGLVDTHVHVNEPGRTDWEGFASATRAAAAGGITTLLDMPLNAIPATTSVAALAAKVAAASGKCHVDVGFLGGVVPANEHELEQLHDAGILAWKCFLVDSGVPEFAAVDEAVLRRVLPRLAGWGLPLMVHAELPGHIAQAPVGVVRRYADYAATRPVAAEVAAVELMLRLAREYAAPIHIVHVSSANAVRLIDAARTAGALVTAETCPHYLTFAAEEIPDGRTAFKCAPPIRGAGEREGLWSALANGTLDMVVSDHSPSPPSLKSPLIGDLAEAWGGIASLQVSLAAVWTGARRRGVSLDRVVQWMAARPSQLVRLGRKGRIAPGCDADFVLFEPDAEWQVDAHRLQQRHPVTPYDGLTLAGRVLTTYLRGEMIYDRGTFAAPAGRLLDRNDA